MKTSTCTAVAVAVTLTATPVIAQTGSTALQARSNDGDRTQIEQVQKALKQQGHDPGPIDGVLGPQTSAALRAYQKGKGLSATGQLDDATRAKLGEPAKDTQQARSGSSASPPTGGDKRPSTVDPAQANKTGANVGEGASYSRSTEKGLSTVKDADKNK